MHPTTKDDYNPSISKRASLNNSNYEITYTITLNEDFKYDISGRTITDTVVSGS